MIRKTLLLLLASVVAAYGANISATTGLDQNTPWLEVLKKLDNGSITLTLSGVTTLTLGTGVGTFLTTPTSANLRAALTDESGTGAAVFANTPTLVTPVIGAATGTSLAVTGKITTTSASTGIGYATGAGGAVTQASSRTTGVTMVPNPCLSGTITTDTTSLAGLATADFVVTDSAVAIGDTVVVSIQSGSNSGGTLVGVSTVTNGTFTIRVHNGNAAAGTAETGAIKINFAILKAVSA